MPVWIHQTQGKVQNPIGMARACASTHQNWGLCKNSKSVGVRAEYATLEPIRMWLRPDDKNSDKSLVGENRSVVPTKTWVLKDVQAKATREELTTAICARWAILPVQILSQREERTT